jgi:hypothetical protein
VRKFIEILFTWLSGEWFLTKTGWPNGGTVVFLRALQITVLVFLFGLLILNVADPDRAWPPRWAEFGRQVADRVQWLGVIFATAYAALYARFASQWTYLAGVYNALKQAQVAGDYNEEHMAEWRAGFVEDCDDLHLLRKPMFASIVHGLISGEGSHVSAVCAAFDQHTPGRQKRRERIAREAKEVVERLSRLYGA